MQRSVKLAPSVYAAELGHLAEQIKSVADTGCEILHVDVMDGHFVQLMAFGPDSVRMLKGMTDMSLDVHLMLEKPERVLDMFIEAGADSISVHAESTARLTSCLKKIHTAGRRTGVALSPATSPEVIRYALDEIDMVLLMTINPGEPGQHFQEAVVKKIADVKEMIGVRDIDIEVDGDINLNTIPVVRKAGANVFVSGRYIFSDPVAHCKELRLAAEGAKYSHE